MLAHSLCYPRMSPRPRPAAWGPLRLCLPNTHPALPPLLPLQVQDVLKQRSKEVGSELRLTDFLRVQVGEGLEQDQKNFADEVAETLKAAA